MSQSDPTGGEVCGGGCTSPLVNLLLEEGLTFLALLVCWSEQNDPLQMQTGLRHSSKSALDHSEPIEV